MQQIPQHRGHTRQRSDFLATDEPQRFFRRPAQHEHHPPTAEQVGEEHRMAAAGVEQRINQQGAGLWRTGRQRRQVHAIAGRHAHTDHACGQLVRPQRCHDGAMAKYGTLGAAGGATGEQHHRRRIGLRHHTGQTVRYGGRRLCAKCRLGVETPPASGQRVRRIFAGHTPQAGKTLVYGAQAQGTPRVRHDQPTMRTG